MQPLRIRVERILESATVVSLVGIDRETGMPVTIHVDHRPFSAVRDLLHDPGATLIEYEADRLMLCLDLVPVCKAGSTGLLERCRSADRANADADLRPVQELDR